jgi:predicted metal-dependent hydrolase
MSSQLPFSYEVVRSRRRRTAALTVDMGRVQVRVPALADANWIEAWVRSKVDWVLPRLSSQQQALASHAVRIEQHALFTFEGRALRLNWARGARTRVIATRDALHVVLSQRVSKPEPDAVRERLRQWMAAEAEQTLVARTFELGRQCGLEPAAVRVRDYRRKWGQCTAKREITLNWRLMHLSPALRDYVLVHELCHLAEMNHSPAFWERVARHCPDYRQHRRSLRQCYPFLMW